MVYRPVHHSAAGDAVCQGQVVPVPYCHLLSTSLFRWKVVVFIISLVKTTLKNNWARKWPACLLGSCVTGPCLDGPLPGACAPQSLPQTFQSSPSSYIRTPSWNQFETCRFSHPLPWVGGGTWPDTVSRSAQDPELPQGWWLPSRVRQVEVPPHTVLAGVNAMLSTGQPAVLACSVEMQSLVQITV